MRRRLRRLWEVADIFDTMEGVVDWIWRILRLLWPIIGAAVIGMILLAWGWLRGNFGPELVAIIMASSVLTANGVLSLRDRLTRPTTTPVITPERGSEEVKIYTLMPRRGNVHSVRNALATSIPGIRIATHESADGEIGELIVTGTSIQHKQVEGILRRLGALLSQSTIGED